jgi:hypothetical protein
MQGESTEPAPATNSKRLRKNIDIDDNQNTEKLVETKVEKRIFRKRDFVQEASNTKFGG